MIFKMLSNMNSVFNHIFMFFILLVVIYLIYKIFLLETEVFLLNEKMNKIELDLNNDDTTINTCKIMNTNTNTNTNTVNLTEEDMKVSEYIMNEIFNEDDKTIIELDIEKEEVFDLKKVVPKKPSSEKEIQKEPLKEVQKEPEREQPDETESISSNVNVMNKKKLQKLNLDKLKEKCTELGLSVEGTKAQLIDRLLEN
jgi:SAP domain